MFGALFSPLPIVTVPVAPLKAPVPPVIGMTVVPSARALNGPA